MSNVVYNIAKQRLNTGLTNWSTSTVKALILTGTASGVTVASVHTVADLLAVASVTEASGVSYARVSVTTRTELEDDISTRITFKADNVVFPTANFGTGVALVTYDEGGGTDATRYLLTYHDTGFPKLTDGSDLIINWPGGIVFYAT